MSCFHPLLAKWNYSNSSRSVKIISSLENSGFTSDDLHSPLFRNDYFLVPCGKCIGCRLDYSRQWAIRCVLEARSHNSDECWFVTLTYDDEHLPSDSFACDDNGEVICPSHSLKKEHLQKFMKDLRRYYNYHFDIDNIRFFGCGEYGSLYMRPHYHLILFGLPIYDLKPYRYQKKGAFPYFESDTLSKIWDRGLVCVGHLTFDSCAYTARYIVKKQKGPDSADYYARRGIIPEFTLMSRRPGIAKEYYDENSDRIYACDNILVSVNGKKYVPRPPKYFDKLFDVDHHDQLSDIKRVRSERSFESQKIVLSRTSLDEFSYRVQCEYDQNKAILDLTRKL